MGKFCSNCGKEIKDDAKFCADCGSKVEKDYVNVGNTPIIKKRDIVISILLSFITCGIYGLYWFITMTDESNALSDEKTASGAEALLYSIVTCGVYFFYWNYKMGQKMTNAGQKYNKSINDNSVLYLILSIFGLSLVNYCLIQNDLNSFSND